MVGLRWVQDKRSTTGATGAYDSHVQVVDQAGRGIVQSPGPGAARAVTAIIRPTRSRRTAALDGAAGTQIGKPNLRCHAPAIEAPIFRGIVTFFGGIPSSSLCHHLLPVVAGVALGPRGEGAEADLHGTGAIGVSGEGLVRRQIFKCRGVQKRVAPGGGVVQPDRLAVRRQLEIRVQARLSPPSSSAQTIRYPPGPS